MPAAWHSGVACTRHHACTTTAPSNRAIAASSLRTCTLWHVIDGQRRLRAGRFAQTPVIVVRGVEGQQPAADRDICAARV